MDTTIDSGTQIGAYQVEALIGQGGMAQVYKAWHTGLQRHEALKLLPPQMTFDRSFVERFLTEARTAAGLRHPHIATIHTVSQPNEAQPFFTMELVEGGDLADLLRRRGRLPLGEALPILRQIAAALDYAHGRGVIHRDVKPANVLLEGNGSGGWNVKVVDFGIARAQEAGGGARLTKTGMIVGTPEYMSPEQGGSGAPVDHRTDLYSLGIIAYEMLCGHPPFSAGDNGTAMTVIMSHIRETPHPPLGQVPGLPLAANNAILKALAKNPVDRFDTCVAFVDALAGVVAVAVPPGPGSPNVTQPAPKRKKAPSFVAPAALGVVVLVGAVMIALGLAKGSHTPGSGATSPAVAPATLGTVADRNMQADSAAATIKVPDLVNLKESQARDFAAATSLHLDEMTAANPSVPPGHIISQSPTSGTLVSPSQIIHVRISTGPAPSTSFAGGTTTPSTTFSTGTPSTSPAMSSPGDDGDLDVSSARQLTEADLAGKSDWDLTLLRNVVYARHGYRFHRNDLRDYFSSKPWYTPTTDNQDAVHSMFSPTEKYNVALIGAYQKTHQME